MAMALPTLEWKDMPTWSAYLATHFYEFFPAKLLRSAIQFDADTFYEDDLQWLLTIGDESGTWLPDDIAEKVAREIRTSVPRVRAYHATRAHDMESFYSRGLLPSSTESLTEMATELFSEVGVTRDEVERAVEDRNLDDEDSTLFLSVDDRDYLTDCGHYLIYGSEFLGGIAARLHALYGPAPKELLRQRGHATVFQCTIQTNSIQFQELVALVRCMLREWFQSICFEFSESRPLDFTFVLHSSVPPNQLERHYHPVEIVDPLEQMRLHREQSTTCPLCA